MFQTYELYLQHAVTGRRFQPLTCRTASQVMQRARELLETDSSLDSVEVRLAGEHLFTLDR